MSDFREILTHGGNYLVANLATRALAFISIPVYTRMLSTNDYGIVSVFMSVALILNSLLALNCDTSVGRYYFDRKSDLDFKRFVGSTISLSSVLIIIVSMIIYSNRVHIANFIKLPVDCVILVLITSTLNIIGVLFLQIYQPQKKSKPIAISYLCRAYLGFFFAIIILLFLTEQKYLGQILGQIIAGLLLLIFWIRKIKEYTIMSFDKRHIKYILSYSVPLIPYALSGIIIEQFAKISIGGEIGFSESGFFSLAISIAGLTGIITEVSNQAWYPYYIEHMQKKDYIRHDKEYMLIYKLTLCFGLLISSFGSEIGLILAKKDFTSGLYLIPSLVIGYLFHQIAHSYMRSFSYSKKTTYMALIVISSGITNVLLNVALIPHFGLIGATIALLISYFQMACVSYIISKYIIKVHTFNLVKLLKYILLPISAIIPLYNIEFIDSLIMKFILHIILFVVLVTTLFYSDRAVIINAVCKIKEKCSKS